MCRRSRLRGRAGPAGFGLRLALTHWTDGVICGMEAARGGRYTKVRFGEAFNKQGSLGGFREGVLFDCNTKLKRAY